MMLTVNFELRHPNAVPPAYATDGSAGMDLVAVTREWDSDYQVFIYDTGVAVEIPEGYVGYIFNRSSVYKTQLSLANAVGILDSDYRGTIKFMFRDLNLGPLYEGTSYEVGDRIGQLVIMPYPKIIPVITDALSSTQRGTNGFGSTGK